MVMANQKLLWRNRKERMEWAHRLQSEDPGLEIVHPHAAGIDVGNSAHYAAVRPDRDPEPVRRFECFTADLHRLADWLQNCGVQTVAMQSTGVYWIPLYEILDERGFEVYLVNARHTKNLPGRKSDVQESQWLLKLHTYGLLNNSFQPAAEIRVARTYWRQRGVHVRGASTCVQRMQKALTQMNVQLANVISDLSGLTGQTIVRAILAGERDSKKLAELSHPQIRASREEIAKSLEGNWRSELLFVLKQEMEMYDTYQRRIAECDQELEAHLKSFADNVPSKLTEEEPPSEQRQGKKVRASETTKLTQRGKKAPGNRPQFDLRSELYRISGVDLTRIDSINVLVAQTVVSEVGLDMSPVEHRGALCFVVGIMSRQPHQWGQGAQQGNPPCDQSGGHGVAHRRDHAASEPHLFGSTIPPLANQTRSAKGDHRHGPQTSPISVSDVEVRSGVHR